MALEEIFYSSSLTILSRSSPRLVLFHGSAQLIAVLVPTLKISTNKLSVVQGDSISSIRLMTPYFMSFLSASTNKIVFWGGKPNKDLRTNQFAMFAKLAIFVKIAIIAKVATLQTRDHFSIQFELPALWLFFAIQICHFRLIHHSLLRGHFWHTI